MTTVAPEAVTTGLVRTPKHAYPIALPATAGGRLPRHLTGLTLDVYRNAGDDYDCTAGGVSGSFTRLVLVGVLDETTNPHARNAGAPVTPLPEDSRVAVPSETAPPVAIEVRRVYGPIVNVVPVQYDEREHAYVRAHGWTMAGGNLAHTCDSRVTALIERLLGSRFYGALAIHDRAEW